MGSLDQAGDGEYREVQPYIYGDFYPLLPYSRARRVLDGLAVGSAGKKDGLIMLLRRPKSPFHRLKCALVT